MINLLCEDLENRIMYFVLNMSALCYKFGCRNQIA